MIVDINETTAIEIEKNLKKVLTNVEPFDKI